MAQQHFLAFDCGATSGRAVLATFADGAFDMKEVYRFPSGIIELNGKYFWDILAIYDHFRKCLAQLGREGVRIDSIGIDTWGVDFGFVADDGSLVGNPRAYRDPYTDGIPEEVFKTVPREELYGATGIQILNFNSIFQLYAQTKEGFAPLRVADKVLFIPDLLAYMLTGNKVCEYTIASTSGMMDQTSRQFNLGLLEKLGVRTDVLLPITQPGTVIGTLRKEIAEACGVPEVPVVAVAGHDTASAIAAVPAADAKFAYLSSGTWSLMGIETPAPIINEASTRLNFTNERHRRHHPVPEEHHRHVAPGAVPQGLGRGRPHLQLCGTRGHGPFRGRFRGTHQPGRPAFRRPGEHGGGNPTRHEMAGRGRP